MPIPIFIQDLTNHEPHNWRLVLETALRDNGPLEPIVSRYQQNEPQSFGNQLTGMVNIPKKFLKVAPYVLWNDDLLYSVVCVVRNTHLENPEFVQWVNDTVIPNKAPHLQAWKMYWAGLSEQWNVLTQLLKEGVQSDLLFSYALAQENKYLVDFIAPFARETLKDPICALALAHDIAMEYNNSSWIDPMLKQYPLDEICQELSLCHNPSLEAFRSYVVQYHLKELPESSSVKHKKM